MKSRALQVINYSWLLLLCAFPGAAQTWIRCSNGLPVDTAVHSMARIGTTIFAGTQHAGIYASSDEGQTWITTNLYDSIRLATVNSMTSIDTFLFAGQSSKGVARKSLNGHEWTYVNNGMPAGAANRIIFNLVATGDTLYAAAYGGGVYISPDKGDHWSVLYNNQGLNDLHALSLAINSTHLFVGTAGSNYTMPDTGVVFVTSLENDTAWTVINNGLARNGAHLEQIFAMTADDEVVYAGTDDVGIHRSIDNGQNWYRIPTTNENGDIWAIKIVGEQVFYGTLYHGIFTSDDNGLTYTVNNAGLNYNGISIPDLVNDFVVLEPYIYAATTTGVYKQLLPQASAVNAIPGSVATVNVFPNPFSTETNLQVHADHNDEQVQVVIMDVFGKEVGHSGGFIQDHTTTIRVDLQDEPSGIYFYSVWIGQRWMASGKLLQL